MEDMNKTAYKAEDLQGIKRSELNRLAKKIGINNLRGKNEEIIQRMVDKSETEECEYDEMGELSFVQSTEERAKVHPVLGKYVTVIITARDNEVKREFFANNDYQCNAPMNREVVIPEGFIKHINTACYSVEHYYDADAINPETGEKGLHTKRQIQDYFCNRVG